MRFIRRAILTAVVGAAFAGGAQAQSGTTTGSTGATGTGLNASTLGTTGSTNATGANANSTTTGAGTQPTQTTSFNTQSLLDTSLGSQITAGALQASNGLGKYYASVYYQGRAGAAAGSSPGGFGNALYGAGGTGSNGITTAAAGTGGAGRAGTTNTTGRTTGTAGGANASGFTVTTQAAQIVQLPRQISYVAVVKFSTPQLTPAKVHTEARAVIDRSSMLSNPRGIEVIGDGALVTIRGTVTSEDESRLVEGMVRLTPGVRDVKNELRFPTPQP